MNDIENFLDCLNNGVDALLSSHVSLAKNHLTKALSIEPGDRFASLLYNAACVMEYDRDSESDAVRQLVSLANNTAISIEAVVEGYDNVQAICSLTGNAIAVAALHCFEILNDTYQLMINNNAVYTGRAFRNYSAVGYGNKIYYPALYKMALSMYELGDGMVDSIGSHANQGACYVWEIGNLLMNVYEHHAGFFEKSNIKSKIASYNRKIKSLKRQ